MFFEWRCGYHVMVRCLISLNEFQASCVNRCDISPIVSLFDLILNVPSAIFQLNRDGSSWVDPVLSYRFTCHIIVCLIMENNEF